MRRMTRSEFSVRSLALVALAGAFGCAGPGRRGGAPDRVTAGIFLEPEERALLPKGVELRKVYEKGLRVTKRSEGLDLSLYDDPAGYCTIGYGHLVKKARCDGSEPPDFLRGLTEPQASGLLADDMGLAERVVMTAVTTELSDAQYAALCDFVFNVGGQGFRKSRLLQAVNDGKIDGVPAQLRRWVYAGGKELPGLKVRREREIELFFDGQPIPKALPGEEELTPIDIRVGE